MALRRRLRDLRTRYEESAASRRGLFDLRARCEESAARRRGPHAYPNPKRTERPPNAVRRYRGEPTQTIRPPNAMRRERGAPTRAKNISNPVPLAAAFFIVRRLSVEYRRNIGSGDAPSERCCGARAQQHMLLVDVAMLTRSRHADTGHSTSEGDVKRARRARTMLWCTCCERTTTNVSCACCLVD